MVKVKIDVAPRICARRSYRTSRDGPTRGDAYCLNNRKPASVRENSLARDWPLWRTRRTQARAATEQLGSEAPTVQRLASPTGAGTHTVYNPVANY